MKILKKIIYFIILIILYLFLAILIFTTLAFFKIKPGSILTFIIIAAILGIIKLISPYIKKLLKI